MVDRYEKSVARQEIYRAELFWRGEERTEEKEKHGVGA